MIGNKYARNRGHAGDRLQADLFLRREQFKLFQLSTGIIYFFGIFDFILIVC